MKLIYRILIRLFVFLTVILTVWGVLFYFAVIDEINDETDDSLEDYSENIITRALAGQELSTHSNGSNNSFYLTEVVTEYAHAHEHIQYSDENVWIAAKGETEPARVLKTIFKDQTGKYFELTVSIPSIEKEDLREAILNWIIVLYFTLLVSVLTINIWVFYGSMKPLYTLLKWLDEYSINQANSFPNLKTNVTEFKKLHTALQQSTIRNQDIFEQQKQFISNASHELQTPLAICQNRLEILAEEESLNEMQLQEINKIQETLSYLIRLNKSLLFLSKIENEQFQEKQTISFNKLLYKLTEDYEEIYHHKNITFAVREEGHLIVEMNETLANSLIHNLLKNACIYSSTQQEIEIHISTQELTITNTGHPEALDKEKIFRRFYQGQNRSKGSSGLGLSIINAICNVYRIQLDYFYTGKHHFRMRFEKSL